MRGDEEAIADNVRGDGGAMADNVRGDGEAMASNVRRDGWTMAKTSDIKNRNMHAGQAEEYIAGQTYRRKTY